jgi:hypothetical protein
MSLSRTGSKIQNGSTATRSAFVGRSGEPDHGIVRITPAQSEQAPSKQNALGRADTSALAGVFPAGCSCNPSAQKEEGQAEKTIDANQEDAFEPRRLAVASDRIDDERGAGDGEQVKGVGEDEAHRPAKQP